MKFCTRSMTVFVVCASHLHASIYGQEPIHITARYNAVASSSILNGKPQYQQLKKIQANEPPTEDHPISVLHFVHNPVCELASIYLVHAILCTVSHNIWTVLGNRVRRDLGR